MLLNVDLVFRSKGSLSNSIIRYLFGSKKAGRYSSARALENERIISNMAVIDRKVMLNFLPYTPAGDYWGTRCQFFCQYIYLIDDSGVGAYAARDIQGSISSAL
jgi:hypothetical protein